LYKLKLLTVQFRVEFVPPYLPSCELSTAEDSLPIDRSHRGLLDGS
jgi:hypothetical protein